MRIARIGLTDVAVARFAGDAHADRGPLHPPPRPLLLSAVDLIPEQTESEPNNTPAQANLLPKLPVTVTGALGAPGDADYFRFEATAGQTLVFDVEARRNGSPAMLRLAIFDAAGKLLNDRSEFDPASDPLLAYTFTKPDRYVVRIDDRNAGRRSENMLTGSRSARCRMWSVAIH